MELFKGTFYEQLLSSKLNNKKRNTRIFQQTVIMFKKGVKNNYEMEKIKSKSIKLTLNVRLIYCQKNFFQKSLSEFLNLYL